MLVRRPRLAANIQSRIFLVERLVKLAEQRTSTVSDQNTSRRAECPGRPPLLRPLLPRGTRLTHDGGSVARASVSRGGGAADDGSGRRWEVEAETPL